MKKAIRIIKKSVLGLALALGAYSLGLAGVQGLAGINSPKISAQSQLEEQLLIERERLGMDKNIVINAHIGNKSFTTKTGSNQYELGLGDDANLSTLRHELYHIYDGHCDTGNLTSIKGRLHYLFLEEPQATIYQTTGLKP